MFLALGHSFIAFLLKEIQKIKKIIIENPLPLLHNSYFSRKCSLTQEMQQFSPSVILKNFFKILIFLEVVNLLS